MLVEHDFLSSSHGLELNANLVEQVNRLHEATRKRRLNTSVTNGDLIFLPTGNEQRKEKKTTSRFSSEPARSSWRRLTCNWKLHAGAILDWFPWHGTRAPASVQSRASTVHVLDFNRFGPGPQCCGLSVCEIGMGDGKISRVHKKFLCTLGDGHDSWWLASSTDLSHAVEAHRASDVTWVLLPWAFY